MFSENYNKDHFSSIGADLERIQNMVAICFLNFKIQLCPYFK